MFFRFDQNLRLLRRFVGIVDAGEVLYLPGPGLFVQTLGIAFFGLGERNLHVDFDEFAGLHAGAHGIAVLFVRADEAGDRDDAGIGEQLGDFADAANVFGAVFGGEAEVLVQAHADVVAIEAIGVLLLVKQHLLQDAGDGALAGGGEAGHPDGDALLIEELLPLLAGDGAFVPGDVGCFLFSHDDCLIPLQTAAC